MRVVILAGGKGTRAYPYTEYLPKPMMPIGGKPILIRVMEIFACQGITDFVISLGYRKDIIIDYFSGRSCFSSFTKPWNVELVDTGEDTDTGGRIYKCRHLLTDTFMATYTDGLCDVLLNGLLDYHRSHDGLATITSVPLISQYGTIEADSRGRILAFKEKPILRDYWINAGFFVMEPQVFDFWHGQNLEREVLPNLQRQNLLYAYCHDGFFKSMDTYKDQQEIEALYECRRTPWLPQPAYQMA
jgi:glucose-1-phosphate cytidylyltransferase